MVKLEDVPSPQLAGMSAVELKPAWGLMLNFIREPQSPTKTAYASFSSSPILNALATTCPKAKYSRSW